MNRDVRTEIFTRLRDQNPNPTTELEWTTPFELLIAVLLSAQATDISVNRVTRKLYPKANTPEAILLLGIDAVKDCIKTIGLYNSKVENMMKTCTILLAKYGGETPRTRNALEELPGVGRKTANVVMNTAFGEPTMAVDTHIFRLANRTRIAPGIDVKKAKTGSCARFQRNS